MLAPNFSALSGPMPAMACSWEMVRGRRSTMLRRVEEPRTKNCGRPMRSDSALRQARSWASRSRWSGVSEAVGSEGVGRVRWKVGVERELSPGAKAPSFPVLERAKPEGLAYLEAGASLESPFTPLVCAVFDLGDEALGSRPVNESCDESELLAVWQMEMISAPNWSALSWLIPFTPIN